MGHAGSKGSNYTEVISTLNRKEVKKTMNNRINWWKSSKSYYKYILKLKVDKNSTFTKEDLVMMRDIEGFAIHNSEISANQFIKMNVDEKYWEMIEIIPINVVVGGLIESQDGHYEGYNDFIKWWSLRNRDV